MPELPEVQTVVNDLKAAGLVGRAITGAQVFWARTVDTLTPEEFSQRIAGQVFQKIWRRGKFIAADLSGGDHLLIHLRMSGRLHLCQPDDERAKHEHVIVSLDNGQQVRFHDTRKFGRMYLVNDVNTIVGHLGPEPLEKAFTAKLLAKKLHSHHRMLKPLLLDQTFLAGLGNIYVDEALWESRLHPQRLSSSVTGTEATALHNAIRTVLERGLQNMGTTLGTGNSNFYSVGQRQGRNRDELHVFRRTDLPCPRCNTIIERLLVGQRGTHICPACQQRGEHHV